MKTPTISLPKAAQPPLPCPGATPDSDRAKKPRLVAPAASSHDVKPGDRVEISGNSGNLIGAFGTVEKANEAEALVKWDDDGRGVLPQPLLNKV